MINRMRPNSAAKGLLALVSLIMLVSMACNAVTGPLQELAQETASPAQPPVQEATLPPAVVTEPVPAEPASPVAPQITATPPANAYAPVFASYPALKVNLPASFSGGGYSLPVDLGQVKYADQITLTGGQRDLLTQNGFVVAAPVPGQYREFYQVYESHRYEDAVAFVTTDSVFHVYHLIFDKMLRDLERQSFIPTLDSLTRGMLQATANQYAQVQGTALEEPARRNLAFFAVAAQLQGLDEPVPVEVQDLVNAELALIEAHAGPAVSPLWDREELPPAEKLIEDYSQYIPRGHYTRSEELKKYFKAMMWYGRLTYRLKDLFETRRALLVVQAVRSETAPDGTPLTKLWQDIYEPTTFIVGKADDLSYFEYGALADSVFGAGAGIEAYADDAKMGQFLQAAEQLPPPQVNSMWVWINQDKEKVTKGYRFMGQRFTLDAYVFGQVIWRNVGTLEKPRGLPKALDFFAALGSEEALDILEQMGETEYANFDTQMDKVRQQIGALEQDSWTQNLYWSWLYTFQPIIEPKDSRYPPFMQTQAWTRKDLNAALGSWTELKHDTILYAKQVMAEMGGGGPDEPPHGYVEPNPEAYARLKALAQMTYDGLSERGMLNDPTGPNLENLIDLLDFLQSASERELVGQALTDDEYWRLTYFGGELEALTLASSDCDLPADQQEMGGCRDLTDQKAALIADVATGLLPDGSLAALEEAVGQPAEIYVVLPDAPLRVAIGAVFSYYEFPVAPDQRMTDEQWQAKVEAGDVPSLPDWTGQFMAP